MPPPAHSVPTPMPPPRRRSSWSQGDQEARPRAGDGVTEADAAAVDVHDVVREAQLARGGHGHGGEGLVDLDQVDVGLAQPGPVQGPGDADRGGQPGASRLDPRRVPRPHRGQRREVVRLGVGPRGQHQGGATVAHARRVARRDLSVGPGERAERGQLLERRVGPGVLVDRHGRRLARPCLAPAPSPGRSPRRSGRPRWPPRPACATGRTRSPTPRG